MTYHSPDPLSCTRVLTTSTDGQLELGGHETDLQGVKAVPMKPPTVPAIKLLVISCVLVYNVSYHACLAKGILTVDLGSNDLTQ
jgi:hypothetical protein